MEPANKKLKNTDEFSNFITERIRTTNSQRSMDIRVYTEKFSACARRMTDVHVILYIHPAV